MKTACADADENALFSWIHERLMKLSSGQLGDQQACFCQRRAAAGGDPAHVDGNVESEDITGSERSSEVRRGDITIGDRWNRGDAAGGGTGSVDDRDRQLGAQALDPAGEEFSSIAPSHPQDAEPGEPAQDPVPADWQRNGSSLIGSFTHSANIEFG